VGHTADRLIAHSVAEVGAQHQIAEACERARAAHHEVGRVADEPADRRSEHGVQPPERRAAAAVSRTRRLVRENTRLHGRQSAITEEGTHRPPGA
jgi:hypothetical protein